MHCWIMCKPCYKQPLQQPEDTIGMKTKKIIKASISTLLMTLCLAGLARAADIKTQPEAISVAAQQRTLTQVMMKNYLFSALGVRSRNADEQLAKATQQFTSQQQQLAEFVADEGVQQQLARMSQSWPAVQQQFQRKPDKLRFKELYSDNETLLTEADSTLKKVVQAKPDVRAQPLSLLGQQELLCQRLVVLYAMTAWGVASEADSSYETITSELHENMALLQALPQNTAEINEQLQQLNQALERTLQVSKARPGALLPALVDRSVVKVVMQLEQLQSDYRSLAGA